MTASLALWPLALLAALLPAAASISAAWLSMRWGLVESCNPFVEGCVSVSRAARSEPPVHLFRALMLPGATLQGLVWWCAAAWLARELGPRASLRWLAGLGVMAALALVLYATFLGTEGQVYRWLRQYGTVVYFGFTCICLLLAGGAVQKLAAAGRLHLPRALEYAMLALAGTLVALGIGNAIVAALFEDTIKARVENVTEWWGSLLFVLGFAALAAMWKRLDVRLRFA